MTEIRIHLYYIYNYTGCSAYYGAESGRAATGAAAAASIPRTLRSAGRQLRRRQPACCCAPPLLACPAFATAHSDQADASQYGQDAGAQHAPQPADHQMRKRGG
jgi:hypothetical protein